MDATTHHRSRRTTFAATLALACAGALAISACSDADGEALESGPEAADVVWEARAPVPEARTEVSVATDGRRIYLIGGFRREGEGTGQPETSAPRVMFAYAPGTDAWSMADSIPEGVNHAGFAAVGGRLYIVGGFRENTFEPTGAVRIYDIEAGTWRDGAPMPTPRGALAVAVVDGRIHAMGGNAADAAGLPSHEHGVGSDESSVGTHEVYDPATDSWTRLAPMPTPRNHLGSAVVGGRIHVVAGRVGPDFEMTTHEVYDPATGTWSAAPPLPTGRSGVAVAALHGQVHVFGGETFASGSRTFDDAERYDSSTEAWERLPPMPTARHGLGAAAFGDAVYVISGGPQPGFAFGTANERVRSLGSGG